MASIKDYVNSPLVGANLNICFSLPLVTTELTQSFVNDSNTVIEACYQFPIPREAVLGNVEIAINGEQYKGKVLEKSSAEERYEEGISEGKRAVLIKDIGDGLYELNLGNLAPEEKATIAITIHQLCHIEGKQIRYFLPTAIAPRYGKREFFDSLEPAENALVSYPFLASLELPADSKMLSSSHKIEIQEDNQLCFSGYLNQDIKFTFQLESFTSQFLTAPFGKEYATLGAYTSTEDMKSTSKGSSVSRSVQLLVDCSGSMSGVSINHVSDGLQEVFSEFPANRDINLIEYGSEAHSLYEQPQKLTQDFTNALATLSADLGGTEIEDALELAITQLKRSETNGDIILLTDGQVWGDHRIDVLTSEANKAGIRIFCIGVGYAISESVLERLSSSTGATLSLVNPHENMATALFKVFMQSAHTNIPAKVSLPDEALPCDNLWHSPFFFRHQSSPVAFISDKKPDVVSVQNSNISVLSAESDTQEAVAQLVAKLLINQMDLTQSTKATELATKANIISQFTSYSMVSEEYVSQADGIPALAAVPQMEKRSYSSAYATSAAASTPVEASYDADFLEFPKFLKRSCRDTIPEPEGDLLEALEARINKIQSEEFSTRQTLTIIERRLDRRSSETRPAIETLSYKYLESHGFDIESVKAYGLKDEMTNCAQFLLVLAERIGFDFNPRVKKLLEVKKS